MPKISGHITGTIKPDKQPKMSNETANQVTGIVGILFILFTIAACAVAGFLPALTGHP